jgi:hypothetical protein
MGRRRNVSAAVVLSLSLAGVVGCGEDADTREAVTPAPVVTAGSSLYADVTSRMEEAGNARFVFSGAGGGEPVSGAASIRFAADGAYTADVVLTMEQSGEVRAVLAPDASYLALPPTKGIPKDKPWLKLTPAAKTPLARRLLPIVAQLRETFDPASGVGVLRAANRVKELGPAIVEGVATTRYRAQVSLDRILAMSDGAANPEYVSLQKAGVTSLRYDVWVDTSGLPRRYRVELPRADGVYSVTGVYRDWGRAPAVKVPAPRSVYDASAIKPDEPKKRDNSDLPKKGDRRGKG